MSKRPIIAILVVAGASALTPAAQARQGGVLTLNGRVGPVQVGKSSSAMVRRKIGRPVGSSRVQTGTAPTKFLRLTYGCGRGKETYFFFDANDRLANFVTNCSSWHTLAGTQVGDDYETAVDAEGKTPRLVPCGDGMVITKRGRARLHVSFDGEDEPVSVIAIEGKNNVLDC